MKFIFFTCVFIGLCACEKNINFKLHETESTLVVDASIENDKPPVVILSNSFDYYSTLSPRLLDSSFVHNAEVSVSDGTKTILLKEYSIDSAGLIRLYYYSVDTTRGSIPFIGKLNTKYDLKVNSQGKEYFSTTTIPILTKKPDSLRSMPAPFNRDTNNVIVMVKATDPPGLVNYVRYYTKRNSGPLLPGQSSVYDDQVVDGRSYEIRVEPGIDRNNKVSYDNNYFRRGDTVILKLCNIDRATYQFWITMEFAYQSIGNPFASPNKVLGNISNGALGAFCGYAAFYKTIIIPH